MKLVIQRVENASVSVNGEVVGEIKKGLLILVGVRVGDTKEKAGELAIKVSKLRIMSDMNDKMNLSIKDVGCAVLAISQFTLYGDTSSGNRPSFIKAEDPVNAQYIYDHFTQTLRDEGVYVNTGKFGEYMKIDSQLDGPVTIIMEN